MSHQKIAAKLLLAIIAPLLLLNWGSFAQLSSGPQVITLYIPRSLYFMVEPAFITYEVTKIDIESPQPFVLSKWHVNIDALTEYRFYSVLITIDTNIFGADISDFSVDCDSSDDWGTCTDETSLSGPDPRNRRGTGYNTAGTDGADFLGDIFLDLRSWDVDALPGFYIGVLLYTIIDTTP
jgi:hypothetical protein